MEGQSFSNKNTATDKAFKYWLSFPITKEQFSTGVVRHCQKYYHISGCRDVKDDEVNLYLLLSFEVIPQLPFVDET